MSNPTNMSVTDMALVTITTTQLTRHYLGVPCTPLLFSVGVGLCLALLAYVLGMRVMRGEWVVVDLGPSGREIRLALVGFAVIDTVDLALTVLV